MGLREDYDDDARRDEAWGYGVGDCGDDDACGPDCVGVVCCRTAAEAARWYCGCGGGVDHSDCPVEDEDNEDNEEDEG